MARPVAKSPYNKYNKKPYRYSQLYHDWRSAQGSERDRLGAKHRDYWLGRAPIYNGLVAKDAE